MVVFVGRRSHLPSLSQKRTWNVLDDRERPDEVRSVLPGAAMTRH